MNEYVFMSIDARRKGFYGAYEINDPEFRARIDDMFRQMEQLGETCADGMAFETALAASPINAVYYDLCAQAAGRFPARAADMSMPEYDVKGMVRDEAADLGGNIVDDLTQPARSQAYQQSESYMRSVPVVGDAMQAVQTAGLFGKLFRRGKKDGQDDK